MKSNAGYINTVRNRDAERLNGAIDVLVIDRVFIVPDTRSRIRDFVGNESNPIDSWSRLNLINRCSSPGVDCRLHSHCGSDGSKSERPSSSGNVEPAI